MAKSNNEQRIKLYEEWRSGVTVPYLSKKYGVRVNNLRYLIKLIDFHGTSILRNGKNRYYGKELKQEIINKVILENISVRVTSESWFIVCF